MKLAEVTSINVNRTKTERWRNLTKKGLEAEGTRKSRPYRDPGIGKSTLPTSFNSSCLKWELFSMSVGRSLIKRAERLGDIDSEFYLYAETNMQSVRSEVERIHQIFSSSTLVQTLCLLRFAGAGVCVSGSWSNALNSRSWRRLIQHCYLYRRHKRSKEVDLGWSRMLLLCDTVFTSKGSVTISFVSWGQSNLFCSTNEIGILRCSRVDWLRGPQSESSFPRGAFGWGYWLKSIVAGRTRPILAEVQALVTPTMFGKC